MAENKTEFLIAAKDATAAAFGSVEKGLGKIGSALGSVQAAILGAVGIGGLGALIKSSMDAVDALAKASDRLGITTEALAGLRYAGDLAGVSAEQLDKGLGKMSMQLAEAAGGSKQANEAFRALGLSAAELTRIPADQAFMQISDALMSVDNNMQRLNLTQEIFGRGAVEIVNLMAEGSEGMAAATAEAKALGLALSRVDAAKIEIANDQFTRIKGIFGGIGNTIAVELAPYLQALGDWLVQLSVEADGFRSHISTAMEVAVWSVGKLMDVFHGLHVVWKILETTWAEFSFIILGGFAEIDRAIVELVNKVPGLKSVQVNPELERAAMDAALAVEKANVELEELMMAKVPSQVLDEFVSKAKELNETLARAKADQAAAMAGMAGIPNATGIGDKEAEQTAKYEAELQKQLEALYNSTAPKLEAMAVDMAMKQALIDEGYLTGLLSEQLYYEQSAALNQQYQEKITAVQFAELTKRQQQEQMLAKNNAMEWQSGYDGKIAVMGKFFGQGASLMQSGNKKMFEIGKKMAIAEAITNTYAGAVGAYKAYASIPYVGPVMGAIAAAAAIALGMSNVQKIRSQQFGSSGGGASGSYPASPNTGLPTAPSEPPTPIAPSLPQGTATGTAAARNVNITIESESGIMSAQYVRDVLIPSINEAMGDGVNLRVTQ